MKKNLVLSSASGLLLYLTNLATTFVIAPFLVHSLGNRDYGAWDVVIGITGYLGVLDLGISPAIVSLVAQASAKSDTAQMRKILRTGTLTLSLVGLISLASMLALAAYARRIINLSGGDIPHVRMVFALLGLNMFIQFTGTASVAYLMGLMQFHFINTLRSIFSIITAMLIYFFLSRASGNGLLHLAAVTTGMNLLQYALIILKVHLTIREPITSLKEFDRTAFIDMVRFGSKSMLLMAADRIQNSCAPLLIAHALGLSHVVFFSIPNRLITYARGFALAAGQPLMSHFGYLEGKKDPEETRRQWIVLSRWTQFMFFGLGIGILTLGIDFLQVWIGPSYANQGKWVLYLGAVAMLIEAISPNSGKYLIGSGKHRLPAQMQLALAVPTMFCIFPAARFGGVSGAAAVLLVSNTLSNTFFWLLACRDLSLSLRQHLTLTILPLRLPLFLSAATFLVVRSVVARPTYESLTISAAVIAAVFAASVWRFSLTANERHYLNGALSRAVRAIGQSPSNTPHSRPTRLLRASKESNSVGCDQGHNP